VVHADGSLLAGHEQAALARYRSEVTPLRESARGGAGRVDMRRARWAGYPRSAASRRRKSRLGRPNWPRMSVASAGIRTDMDRPLPSYRLVRRPAPAAAAPRLDDAQQRVVSHSAGPLLVLAGPGTGKTTAIVEAVVERI